MFATVNVPTDTVLRVVYYFPAREPYRSGVQSERTVTRWVNMAVNGGCDLTGEPITAVHVEFWRAGVCILDVKCVADGLVALPA